MEHELRAILAVYGNDRIPLYEAVERIMNLIQEQYVAPIRDLCLRHEGERREPGRTLIPAQQILAILESVQEDGFCICEPGRPARDCGIRAHRQAAQQ